MPRTALKLLGIALPVAALLALAPTPAQAQWHRGGGYGYGHGGYGYGYGHRGYGGGAIVGGALLGLGVGALLAAPYYAAPPPVVYAPPPAYYAPPAYAYAPPPAPARLRALLLRPRLLPLTRTRRLRRCRRPVAQLTRTRNAGTPSTRPSSTSPR